MARQSDPKAKALEAAIDQLTHGAGKAQRRSRKAVQAPAFHRILVAADGTPASMRALEWGAALAKDHAAQAAVVTVAPFEDYLRPVEGVYGPATAASAFVAGVRRPRQTVDEAKARLGELGVRAEAQVLYGSPVSELARAVRAWRADLLVVGSHDQGKLAMPGLGGVAQGVKNLVPCSVLIARRSPSWSRILCAVDGSALSKAAARVAHDLAMRHASELTILHVYPYNGRSILDMAPPRPQGRTSFLAEAGSPAAGVVAAGHRSFADLIVLGSRGLGGLATSVLGSVSDRITSVSDCSVLVVKPA